MNKKIPAVGTYSWLDLLGVLTVAGNRPTLFPVEMRGQVDFLVSKGHLCKNLRGEYSVTPSGLEYKQLLEENMTLVQQRMFEDWFNDTLSF